MNNNNIALGLLLLLGVVSACEKKRVDNIISNPPRVWGKMSAILQHRMVISGPDTLHYHDEIALAEFYANPDVPGVYADGGVVKINNNELTKDASNFYMKEAQNLDMQNNLDWHVSGLGGVPAMHYEDTAVYPAYTGPIPGTLNKTTGVSLTFDATTVSGADSVRVYIDDGAGNTVWRTFGAAAGNVLISSSDMSALTPNNTQGAVIAISPYTGKIVPRNSRAYYYIKERRVRQSVNIN